VAWRGVADKTFFKLSAMPHSAEFFGIANSREKISSASTEAVKVTVYQKFSHR
jgi:hypothetical protein